MNAAAAVPVSTVSAASFSTRRSAVGSGTVTVSPAARSYVSPSVPTISPTRR